MAIIFVGIDLAKNVFTVWHEHGKAVPGRSSLMRTIAGGSGGYVRYPLQENALQKYKAPDWPALLRI